MNYPRFYLVIGILVAVLAFVFLFSVPRTYDDVDEQIIVVSETEAPKVSLKDVFKKGAHTLTGSIEAPNACASVDAEAMYEKDVSGEERISIAITLTQHDGICLQLPTQLRFSESVSAPADLPISVTVNGEPVTYTTP